MHLKGSYRSIFDLLIHFPNGPNCRGWDRLKPGASCTSPKGVAGPQACKPFSTAFPRPVTEQLGHILAPIWDAGIASSGFARYAAVLASELLYQLFMCEEPIDITETRNHQEVIGASHLGL